MRSPAAFAPTEGTVLITGASSGIGRALARRLAAEARRLILVARRIELLDELADELRTAHAALSVEVVSCDLTDLAATETMIEQVLERGPVDVLVNNAGVGERRFFETAPWEKLERVVATNVLAFTYLVRRVLPSMIAREKGGILCVGSVLGESPLPTSAVYAGTKHYVVGFTDSLRAEVAGTGVVITEVRPGPVRTGFEEASDNDTGVLAPGWLAIDAHRCAAEALAGFRRGRAVVIPGRMNRLVTLGLRLVPRCVVRWALARWAARRAALSQVR